MEENKNKKGQEINIELSEEIAEGIYSNLALITHSNSEFIVDFIRMVPGVKKSKVQSRIIVTPQHAKRLLRALQDNIQKFEQSFGEIKDHGESMGLPLNIGPSAKA